MIRAVCIDLDGTLLDTLPDLLPLPTACCRSLSGSQAELYDGVMDGLNSLRGMGLNLACVTNKPGEFVGPLLQRFGLESYFDFAIDGDTLPFKKPHPGQLLEACRRWGLEPSRVQVVGDSVNDAEAARAAGMPVVLVPYGYNEGNRVYGADVDGIVSSLSEFACLIQGQNARVC